MAKSSEAAESLAWLLKLCAESKQLETLLLPWHERAPQLFEQTSSDYRPGDVVLELGAWLAGLVDEPELMQNQLRLFGATESQLATWTVEARQALSRDPEPPIDWIERLLRHLPHWLEAGLLPFTGYYSLRRLHFLTRGRSSRLLALVHQALCPPAAAMPQSSLLGAPQAAQASLAKLALDSVTVLPGRLPAEMVAEIQAFARATPCYPSLADTNHRDLITGESCLPKVIFDASAPMAHRYDFHFAEIWECPAVQRIAADGIWPWLAEQYLGCRAQLTIAYMWWSCAFDGPQSRYTGQVFHVDADRFHFVNFFIYLCDVDLDNGAQRYVLGSHRDMPLDLASDQRWTDAELAERFPADRFANICAPAGSVLMADTLALHKGSTLNQGNRLMLQMEFAASTLGENTPTVPRPHQLTPELAQALKDTPERYPKLLNWV